MRVFLPANGTMMIYTDYDRSEMLNVFGMVKYIYDNIVMCFGTAKGGESFDLIFANKNTSAILVRFAAFRVVKDRIRRGGRVVECARLEIWFR
jgi:hypothetical protein